MFKVNKLFNLRISPLCYVSKRLYGKCSHINASGSAQVWDYDYNARFQDLSQKYDAVKREDPLMKRKSSRCVYQQYELFPSCTDDHISNSNQLLKKLSIQLMSTDELDVKKSKYQTLTPIQFSYARRAQNIFLFRRNIQSIISEQNKIITQLFGERYISYFKLAFENIFEFDFKAYGHPFIVLIFDKIVEQQTIPMGDILDLMYYVIQLREYKYSISKEKYTNFLSSMRWLKRFDLRMESDEFYIYTDSKSLYYSLHIKDYWKTQTEKYMKLLEITELLVNSGRLDKHDTATEYTVKHLNQFIVGLYNNKEDPFFNHLWDNMLTTSAQDIQECILNRWNLDVGNNLINNADILVPILYNNDLLQKDKSGKIQQYRNDILKGKSLNEDTMNKLEQLLKDL